jgi:predicted secreted protein
MNAKTYFGVAGTTAATEITNITDVEVTLNADEAEATTRANSGWKATVATLRECTVEFEMIWAADDPAFAAIRTAYLTAGLVALKVLDRANGEGPDGDFAITSFSRSEPLAESIKAKVTAKLSVFREWIDPAA